MLDATDLAASQPAPLPAPGRTVAPAPTSLPLPAASRAPTHIPTVAPAAPAPATATSTASAPLPPDHFWLSRPIGADGVYYVDASYRYGDTQNGLRAPHHGVEFQNPQGTPVLAVAPATVVVAGKDWTEMYGPTLFFYGGLVVLQLDQSYGGQPVFVLYAHLSEVSVQVGQAVQPGEVLGRVGGTGVALGPHLHLEVRIGRDDYVSTRNPELWLQPLAYNGTRWGVIAARVTDKQGNLLPGVGVTVRSLQIRFDNPVSKYAFTYAAETLNGDDVLRENAVISDLPPGTYEVSVNTTTLYRQTVTVESGAVTRVEFAVNPPPPPTTAPTPTP